jgi:hypothetical protein
VLPLFPRRIFLDAGVIIEGCVGRWGSAKGVLVLATLASHYSIVLAQSIETEVHRGLARFGPASIAGSSTVQSLAYMGWVRRVRIERRPAPSAELVQSLAPTIIPVLRHLNDLEAVVSAIEARPDWVISSNDAHWNPALVARTGLRIATPRAFLEQTSEWAARYEQGRQPGSAP